MFGVDVLFDFCVLGVFYCIEDNMIISYVDLDDGYLDDWNFGGFLICEYELEMEIVKGNISKKVRV